MNMVGGESKHMLQETYAVLPRYIHVCWATVMSHPLTLNNRYLI